MKQMNKKKIFVSVHDLSQYFGVGIRRVQQLQKAGVFPANARGEFDLKTCTRLYIEYLKTWRAEAQIPASVNDLARCFQVSKSTIPILAGRGIIPRIGKHGRYDLIPCVQAYIGYLNKNGQLSLLENIHPVEGRFISHACEKREDISTKKADLP